ncbi:MAG: hypothetical protein HKO68_04760 [Desulfobacterales bacterium]|nr:hypothetical protein [Desulfobacterales bacterium]
MKKNIKKAILWILVIGLAALISGIAVAGSEINITGAINEDGELVDDNGNAYEIADTEQGNEVMDMVGKKVSVKGTVMEEEGTRTISITSFDVIEQ